MSMARRWLSEASLRQGYICDASRTSSSARQRTSLALSQSKASHLAGGVTLQSLAALTRCSGRRRPSFSVPRLRRGVHRPAAAALRSGPVMGGRAGWLSRGCGGAAHPAGRCLIRCANSHRLPRAAARLSIKPGALTRRKDGRLAITPSWLESLIQNS